MLAHLKKISSVIDHTAECICPNFNLVVRSMRRQATARSFPTDPKSQLSKSSAGPISLITNSSTVMFQQIDSVVCMFVIWRILNLSSSTHLTWLHNAIHRSLPPNRSSNLVRNKLNVTRTQEQNYIFWAAQLNYSPLFTDLEIFCKNTTYCFSSS